MVESCALGAVRYWCLERILDDHSEQDSMARSLKRGLTDCGRRNGK